MIINLEKKNVATNSLKSNQTTSRSNAHENKTKEIEKCVKITYKRFNKWHTKCSYIQEIIETYIYTNTSIHPINDDDDLCMDI